MMMNKAVMAVFVLLVVPGIALDKATASKNMLDEVKSIQLGAEAKEPAAATLGSDGEVLVHKAHGREQHTMQLGEKAQLEAKLKAMQEQLDTKDALFTASQRKITSLMEENRGLKKDNVGLQAHNDEREAQGAEGNTSISKYSDDAEVALTYERNPYCTDTDNGCSSYYVHSSHIACGGEQFGNGILNPRTSCCACGGGNQICTNGILSDPGSWASSGKVCYAKEEHVCYASSGWQRTTEITEDCIADSDVNCVIPAQTCTDEPTQYMWDQATCTHDAPHNDGGKPRPKAWYDSSCNKQAHWLENACQQSCFENGNLRGDNCVPRAT